MVEVRLLRNGVQQFREQPAKWTNGQGMQHTPGGSLSESLWSLWISQEPLSTGDRLGGWLQSTPLIRYVPE